MIGGMKQAVEDESKKMVEIGISENDQLVLEEIRTCFPAILLIKVGYHCNPQQTTLIDTKQDDDTFERAETIRLFERDKNAGISAISALIEIRPRNSLAALLNDRAQMFVDVGNLESALSDLNLAIEIGEPEIQIGEPKTETGENSKRILSQAYCQRAMISTRLYFTRDKNIRKEDQKDDIPAGAKRDFERAAELGNQFARQELARLNPYAKMCNALMAEYLQRNKYRPN